MPCGNAAFLKRPGLGTVQEEETREETPTVINPVDALGELLNPEGMTAAEIQAEMELRHVD